MREDGQKVLLAVKNMGGETGQAWRIVSEIESVEDWREFPPSADGYRLTERAYHWCERSNRASELT